MEDHAYIGELAASIIYLLAGVRLILLGIRTTEVPERLLGTSFVFIGVSSLLYTFAVFPIFESVSIPLNFAARVSYLPGSILIAFFTERVFREGERWAMWFAWGAGVLATAGVVGSALGGDWEGFSIRNGWFWLEWVGYTLPFGWAATEAFNQYRQARRRMSLGLCEPVICNRLLLWSLFGVAQFASCVVVIGQYAAFERESVFSATWDNLYGAATISGLIMISLAFFPPASYLRWVERTTRVPDVERD